LEQLGVFTITHNIFPITIWEALLATTFNPKFQLIYQSLADRVQIDSKVTTDKSGLKLILLLLLLVSLAMRAAQSVFENILMQIDSNINMASDQNITHLMHRVRQNRRLN
jgi:uncharacterized membrane protein